MLFSVKMQCGSTFHRFALSPPATEEEAPSVFATLQDNVRQCLQLTGSARYILKYRDEADEEVTLQTAEDLNEAFVVASQHGLNPLRLFVYVCDSGEEEEEVTGTSSSLEITPTATIEVSPIMESKLVVEQVLQACQDTSETVKEATREHSMTTAELRIALEQVQAISAELSTTAAGLIAAREAPAPAPVPAPVEAVSAVESSEPAGPVHTNVYCDHCEELIVGVRFKCCQCANFDLCAKCEAKDNHEAGHFFLKLRRPVLSACINELLHPQPKAKKTALKTTTLRRRSGRRRGRGDAYTQLAEALSQQPQPVVPVLPVPTESHILGPLAAATLQQEAPVQQPHPQPVAATAPTMEVLEPTRAWAAPEAEPRAPLRKPTRAPPVPSADRRRKPVTQVLNATFSGDVNLHDGSVVEPGQLIKLWKCTNTGNAPWPSDTKVVYVEGNLPGSHNAFDLPNSNVSPGDETLVEVQLEVPNVAGRYRSSWRLSAGGKTFGHRFWCDVVVPAPEHSPVAPETTIQIDNLLRLEQDIEDEREHERLQQQLRDFEEQEAREIALREELDRELAERIMSEQRQAQEEQRVAEELRLQHERELEEQMRLAEMRALEEEERRAREEEAARLEAQRLLEEKERQLMEEQARKEQEERELAQRRAAEKVAQEAALRAQEAAQREALAAEKAAREALERELAFAAERAAEEAERREVLERELAAAAAERERETAEIRRRAEQEAHAAVEAAFAAAAASKIAAEESAERARRAVEKVELHFEEALEVAEIALQEKACREDQQEPDWETLQLDMQLQSSRLADAHLAEEKARQQTKARQVIEARRQSSLVAQEECHDDDDSDGFESDFSVVDQEETPLAQSSSNDWQAVEEPEVEDPTDEDDQMEESVFVSAAPESSAPSPTPSLVESFTDEDDDLELEATSSCEDFVMVVDEAVDETAEEEQDEVAEAEVCEEEGDWVRDDVHSPDEAEPLLDEPTFEATPLPFVTAVPDQSVQPPPYPAAPNAFDNLLSREMTAISQAPTSVSPVISDPVASLREANQQILASMGFFDRALNNRLLAKHQNDIEKTINELLSSVDNDWHANRH